MTKIKLFKKEREWQRGKVATKIEVDDDGTVNVRYHNTIILKKSNHEWYVKNSNGNVQHYKDAHTSKSFKLKR